MEDLIKKFLAVDGSGYGYGSGDGYGYGSGYGSGDGSGSGDGYGYGYGSGSGDGSGDGYGDGYGSGSGSGDGYGDGSGYGSGDGSGSGDGYGSGYGLNVNPTIEPVNYRKGFIDKQIHGLDKFNGKKVYYIDNIPCVFISIKRNIAEVQVIKDDFTLQKQFVAKLGDLFAHGDTKQQSLKSVNDKFFASISFEQKKEEFLKLFKKDTNYKAKLFFDWHHFLTGSCESGRMMFVKSRNIDLESEMTVNQFFELTKNEYNGENILELMSNY